MKFVRYSATVAAALLSVGLGSIAYAATGGSDNIDGGPHEKQASTVLADTPEPTGSSASGAVAAEQLKDGISVGSAAYATFATSPGFHYAPSPISENTAASSASTEPSDATVSPLAVAGDCNYSGKADYPHVSAGQASVHGYWLVNSLAYTCPSTATVTVDLQAYACSSLYGCTWITQATDSGTFKPGSGTGYWATPHKTCASTALVGWRGRVDVDLTGKVDPSGYDYSVEKDLNCSPA